MSKNGDCTGPCTENESATSTIDKTKFMPRWHVILHNTDTHTIEFVVQLIMVVFKKNIDDAFDLTMKIHKEGLCIAETTHKERAELLRELVEGYGVDPNMKGAKVTLPCTIEEAPGD